LNLRIQLEDVWQRYRVVRERPDSLREAFTRIFHKRHKTQEFDAVRGVSLKVMNGEVVGFIGRNGSGKSTLLKLIAGVYKPTTGTVEVHGTVAALIELGAGFHPDLTGRENMILNGLMMGLTRKQIQAREQKIIDFAELGEFIDSPLKQYSSGMYMRLAFAVAIEVDPDILLVDEILSVGDAEFQEKCDRKISDFCQRGKTIVFVSHDMHAIRRVCTRLVLLDHGQILANGPVEEVIARYEELIHLDLANPAAATPAGHAELLT